MSKQTRYGFGSYEPVDDDYDGEQFYTIDDAIANDDWEFIREAARRGDRDAQRVLHDIHGED